MSSEVALAVMISEQMRRAAMVASSGAGEMAAINLRKQWASNAADSAQITLQHYLQEMKALADAAVQADRLAQESIPALMTLQQAGTR